MTTSNTYAVAFQDYNKNYFGPLKNGKFYVDTNQVVIPSDKDIIAVSLYRKENRVAPAIGYRKSGEIDITWIKNSDMNNECWLISEDETYINSALAIVPDGYSFFGLQLIQSGNQLSYKIGVQSPGGTQEWIAPPESPYISPQDYGYADSNEVILPPNGSNTMQGFRLLGYKGRIAPSLLICSS